MNYFAKIKSLQFYHCSSLPIIFYVIQLFIIIFTCSPSCSLDAPEAFLEWGKILGFTQRKGNKLVDCWLGIPYLEAALDSNRFRLPRPFRPSWNLTLDATEFGPACPEPYNGNDMKRAGKLIVRSEDCLFLNIWVPRSTRSRSSSRHGSKGLPVMVYAHGGGLVMLSAGDSKFMDGAQVAATDNVVIVTMNFRLGTLGWLYCDKDEIPGNMGLHDTLAAIQWVHSNIAAFGGDPTRITAVGLSSGASMMAALFIGGHLNKYISGLVLHSGPGAIVFSESKELSLRRCAFIAQHVGCRTLTQPINSKVIDCLRSTPSVQLLVAQTTMALNKELLGFRRPEVFVITTGDKLFPHNMSTMIAQRKWRNDIPISISLVPDEASVIESHFPRTVKKSVQDYYNFLLQWAPIFVPNHPSPKIVANDLAKVYIEGNSNTSLAAVDFSVRQMIGDWYITCPTLWLADVFAKTNPVWSSMFTYSTSPENKNLPALVAGREFGTRHGAEIFFYFGVPHYESRAYNDLDRSMATSVMLSWTRFIRHGNAAWSPYQVTSRKRIIPFQKEFNAHKNDDFVEPAPDRLRCYVWDDLFHSRL